MVAASVPRGFPSRCLIAQPQEPREQCCSEVAAFGGGLQFAVSGLGHPMRHYFAWPLLGLSSLSRPILCFGSTASDGIVLRYWGCCISRWRHACIAFSSVNIISGTISNYSSYFKSHHINKIQVGCFFLVCLVLINTLR